MAIILQIISYGLMAAAAGYILGRIGHCHINDLIGNPAWVPHHWIYGALLIPTGTHLMTGFWGLVIVFFGIGHFISDLKDFLELKFFSPDAEGPKHFFHID